MTRVDFYILPETDSEARLRFTCRIVEKAWKQGHQVFIATADAVQAEQLNRILWAFKPESFVPHHRQDIDQIPSTIAIGSATECGDHHDLLINLCAEIPLYFSRFQRLIEVVCQQDHILSATRQHFAFYRERGYPIKSHDMRTSANSN